MKLKKILFSLFIIVLSLNGFSNEIDSVFSKAQALLNSDFDGALAEVGDFNETIQSKTIDEQGEFHIRAAGFYQMIGDFESEAYHWIEQKKILTPASDTLNKIRYYLGRAYMNSAKWDDAFAEFEKFEKHAINNQDTSSVAAAYDALASVKNYQGDKESAIAYYLKAIRIVEITGPEINLSQIYSNMSIVYVEMGEEEGAYNARKKAYEIALSSEQEYAIHKTELGLATSYNDQEKTDSALVLLKMQKLILKQISIFDF